MVIIQKVEIPIWNLSNEEIVATMISLTAAAAAAAAAIIYFYVQF